MRSIKWNIQFAMLLMLLSAQYLKTALYRIITQCTLKTRQLNKSNYSVQTDIITHSPHIIHCIQCTVGDSTFWKQIWNI